jgi:hypothetical protein
MSGLQRFRERLIPGVKLTCVENTYRPVRNGVEHIITGVYCGRVGCKRVTGGDGPVTIALPEKNHGVVWVDENTIRWPLGIGAHSVTYRIGDAA